MIVLKRIHLNIEGGNILLKVRLKKWGYMVCSEPFKSMQTLKMEVLLQATNTVFRRAKFNERKRT